jgi:hypothetical protein
MSLEEKNKNNTNNSLDDNDDKSDSDEYSEENSYSNRGMSQEKREYYLSKLFNQEQSDRFDKYKESSIEHDKKNRSLQKLECPNIKKVVQNLIGDVQIGNLVQIILNGVTKIYAGELVEEAKKIMVEEDEVNEKDKNKNKKLLGNKRYNSPIRPRHLREARRRMIERGVLPLILNNNNKVNKNKIL